MLILRESKRDSRSFQTTVLHLLRHQHPPSLPITPFFANTVPAQRFLSNHLYIYHRPALLGHDH